MKAAFHRVQKISLRLYNYPQRTNKQSFYSYQGIMHEYMQKLLGKTPSRGMYKMQLGYDNIHGEYLSIVDKKLTNKGNKDKIIWINARG